MKVLVFGGAGFVGSSLAAFLSQSHEVSVMDSLVRRGSELNLEKLRDHGVTFLHGDIRNPEDFELLPDCELIIDASADPSVLSGLDGSPQKLIQTNLTGTVNIAEFACKKRAKLIFLSTSRVYSIPELMEISLEEDKTRFRVTENSKMKGVSSAGISEAFSTAGYRSFYGTSKLSSEMLLEEYRQYKSLDVLINRFGVIAGPGQFGRVDQGVLVHWILSHMWRRNLSYIGFGGAGKQVRDFLHIDDAVRFVSSQVEEFGAFGTQTLNVGGGQNGSMSLLELTTECERVTGNKLQIGSVKETRQADVPYYVSDSRKAGEKGWKPLKSNKTLVEETFSWISRNETILKKIL